MKKLILFMLFPLLCSAEKIYFNDGNVLEAKILDANETHIRIERSEDLQQFRVKTDLLTEDYRGYKKPAH